MEKISDYNQLVQYLKDNSNAEFNEFNSKIVNSGVETIGCTVPFMRKLAKSLDLDFALSLPVNKYMEVDLLRGIVISNAKLPLNQSCCSTLQAQSKTGRCATVRPSSLF